MTREELWQAYKNWYGDGFREPPPDVEIRFLKKSIFFKRPRVKDYFDGGKDFYSFEYFPRERR
jgi:hypothetical protein